MSAAPSIPKTLSRLASPARPGIDGPGVTQIKTNGSARPDVPAPTAAAAAPCSIPLSCPLHPRRPLISRSAATAILNSTDAALDMAIERGEFPIAFDVSGGGKTRRCVRIPSRHVLAYKQGLPLQKGETASAFVESILPHRARFRGREVAYWLHLDPDSVCGLVKSGRLAGAMPAKRCNGCTVTREALVQFLKNNVIT
jgi:hypothetical protein